jgi:hypothetical protein
MDPVGMRTKLGLVMRRCPGADGAGQVSNLLFRWVWAFQAMSVMAEAGASWRWAMMGHTRGPAWQCQATSTGM